MRELRAASSDTFGHFGLRLSLVERLVRDKRRTDIPTFSHKL